DRHPRFRLGMRVLVCELEVATKSRYAPVWHQCPCRFSQFTGDNSGRVVRPSLQRSAVRGGSGEDVTGRRQARFVAEMLDAVSGGCTGEAEMLLPFGVRALEIGIDV